MSDFPGEPLTGTTGTVVPSWNSLMIEGVREFDINACESRPCDK
jgi:hypothetical protein